MMSDFIPRLVANLLPAKQQRHASSHHAFISAFTDRHHRLRYVHIVSPSLRRPALRWPTGLKTTKSIAFNEASMAERRNAGIFALYAGCVALGVVGVADIASVETGLHIPLAGLTAVIRHCLRRRSTNSCSGDRCIHPKHQYRFEFHRFHSFSFDETGFYETTWKGPHENVCARDFPLIFISGHTAAYPTAVSLLQRRQGDKAAHRNLAYTEAFYHRNPSPTTSIAQRTVPSVSLALPPNSLRIPATRPTTRNTMNFLAASSSTPSLARSPVLAAMPPPINAAMP
jgi:hypothetical protein